MGGKGRFHVDLVVGLVIVTLVIVDSSSNCEIDDGGGGIKW